MPVNETDYELIESYLDDALDAEHSKIFQCRLLEDPEMGSELQSIRNLQTARQAVWSSFEPDETSVNPLIARIIRAAHTNDHPVKDRPAAPPRIGWLQPLKYIAAAAACVAVGVFIRPPLENVPSGAGPVVVNNKTVDVRPVSMYEVILRDQAGAVIAVQRFDTVEKAQEFAADLSKWQSHQERLASGRFIVSADRF